MTGVPTTDKSSGRGAGIGPVRLLLLALVLAGASATGGYGQDQRPTPPPPAGPIPGLADEYIVIEESAAAPAEQDRKSHLDAGWDKGLRFTSPDDQFHIHVGGNAQIDSTWLIGPQSVFALPGGGANGIGNSSATFLAPRPPSVGRRHLGPVRLHR